MIVESYLAGEWSARGEPLEVRSPYSGAIVGTVPQAGLDEADRALAAAVEGARDMAALPAHERAAILHRAAALLEADAGELAALITAEQGKHTGEASAEAGRIAGIVRLCAEEALRIGGELVPMDAAAVSAGSLGYARREPCGVVVAITPFNYPAVLVIHKLGPALAAGNAVVLKPAQATPLSALFIVERLVRAGLPPLALQCVVGPGATLGAALCGDRRVRAITFTGGNAAGQAIARAAGAKRLVCELGSNCAAVVHADADVERAAAAIAHSGYTNAGQNCVSTQRVLVHETVRDELLERLTARLRERRAGDPADPRTDVSPLIDAAAAERVQARVRGAGGSVVAGGERDGAVLTPAVVLEPDRGSALWREELFGPAVAVAAFASEDEALRQANDTPYGLAAVLFTRDLDRALRFAHGLRAGMVNVNPPLGATWRADFMPWGGVGASGFGTEGVPYAIEELTDRRLVVIHPGATA